jgi:hypothetical protein
LTEFAVDQAPDWAGSAEVVVVEEYKIAAAFSALAVVVTTYGLAAPSADAEERAVPRKFQVVQLNLCGHQVNRGDCFDRPGSGGAMTPRKKRNEAVRVIRARDPNAVTLNEVCADDVRRIARRTNYEGRFAPVKNVSRCSKGRGWWGIAVMARNFSARDVLRGHLLRGLEGESNNRWICATTASRVMVCTSHLKYGAHSSDPDAVQINERQCGRLKDLLENRRPAVVFGGDVNRYGSDGACRKDSMWGRSDWDSNEGTAGLQHIYVDDWAFDPVADHGWVRDMSSTDHPAFGVRMRRG